MPAHTSQPFVHLECVLMKLGAVSYPYNDTGVVYKESWHRPEFSGSVRDWPYLLHFRPVWASPKLQ